MRTINPKQAHSSLATTGTASTLATLGFTKHAETNGLLIQVVGGDVRYTLNGTAPSTTLGNLLNDGDAIELVATDIPIVKFISSTGTPKLEIVSFYNLD